MTHGASVLVIPLSKKKIVLLVLAAAVFVALGVWLYLHANTLRGNALLTKLVGITSVIFFGLCGIYGSRRLLDSTPGLIIDAQGLVDNSSGVSAGRIPWQDITGFKVTEIKGQRFLTIEVRNPDKYILQTSGMKRHLVSMNAKYFGGPIHITSNTLDMRFDELLKNITEARAKYGGA